MATDVNKNVSDIKEAQDKLVDSRGKLSRFSYTEEAYASNEAYGVPSYNYTQEQNVPLATTEALETNATTINKGFREQASSIPRQLMNHFLGRTSYNLNKINDYFNSLIVQFLRHLSQDDNAYSATAVYVPDDICFILDASHNKRTFRYAGTVAGSGHAPLKDNGELDTAYWNEINVSTVNGKTGKVILTGADVAISGSNAIKISKVLGKISGSPNSANGTVKLDSSGRIPYRQLPESAITLMGDWDASTNTPTLNNGTGTLGEMYLVSVAGTWNGIEFTVNDRIIYNGSIWRKMEGGSVNSVNDISPVGGNVTLTGSDIKTSVTLQDKTTETQTVQNAINNKQSTPVEITQANYNRLTATQRAKNIYIITDATEIEDTYINDNVTANDTAWSSQKTLNTVNNALAEYQKFKTAPDPKGEFKYIRIKYAVNDEPTLLISFKGFTSVLLNLAYYVVLLKEEGNRVYGFQSAYTYNDSIYIKYNGWRIPKILNVAGDKCEIDTITENKFKAAETNGKRIQLM